VSALAFAIALLQSLPALLAAGVQIGTFVEQQVALLTAMNAAGRDPTPEEWAALQGAIAGDSAALAALGAAAQQELNNGKANS
jgi:hypothetical protein